MSEISHFDYNLRTAFSQTNRYDRNRTMFGLFFQSYFFSTLASIVGAYYRETLAAQGYVVFLLHVGQYCRGRSVFAAAPGVPSCRPRGRQLGRQLFAGKI